MRVITVSFLMLAACSGGTERVDRMANETYGDPSAEVVPENRMEEGIARAVTIGEDGPRLPACGARGVVRARSVELRAAPFQQARVLAQLGEGQVVTVCTRSLDQRWLGVVVPPAASDATAGNATAPALECDVSDPVDRRRAYDGPCASGWVFSARVQLVG